MCHSRAASASPLFERCSTWMGLECLPEQLVLLTVPPHTQLTQCAPNASFALFQLNNNSSTCNTTHLSLKSSSDIAIASAWRALVLECAFFLSLFGVEFVRNGICLELGGTFCVPSSGGVGSHTRLLLLRSLIKLFLDSQVDETTSAVATAAGAFSTVADFWAAVSAWISRIEICLEIASRRAIATV